MIVESIRTEVTARFIAFDLEDDEELLEIVELASAVTYSPIAVITLLDETTQYLKVRKGVNEKSMPREDSLCSYAIEGDELMMVNNLEADARFVNSLAVKGKYGIRFYAAMPLKTSDGVKLGTLCVLDNQPKTLNKHQQMMLEILAKQVIKSLELRVGIDLLEKKQDELQRQVAINQDAHIRLRSFFESSTNFQVLLGKNAEVIDFNKTAYNFIRAVHQREITRNDQFIKYLHPEFVATFVDKYAIALTGKKCAVEGSTDYAELGVIWWEASFEAARDANNEIAGISYLIRNVTERKLKEQKIISQNQSLLKIAHIQAHEFRAPLTTIMGLMSLIKEDAYNPPSEYIHFLEQAVDALDTTIRHIVTDIDNAVIQDYVSDLQNS